MKKKYNAEFHCVLKDVLEIVGGKWSIPIILTLLKGTHRFKELERTIPNINTRMLVKELKKLEQSNILHRKVYATVPPTVEYSLTPKGRAMENAITQLYKWGREYVHQ